MSIAEWVQVITGVATCLGVVLLLAKNTGAWQATRESADVNLESEVSGLKGALSEKAEVLERTVQEKETALRQRLDLEHELRREFMDKTNVALGKLDVERGRHDERLKRCEADVMELRRKVYNGSGLAGV